MALMDQLPYNELTAALVTLEHLQFVLDFSAWLIIEYEGKPAQTLVSLAVEPGRAIESRVTSYLADEVNQDRLRLHWLYCPLCNAQYFAETVGRTCPAQKRGDDGQRIGHCGELLLEVVEVVSKPTLRERARSKLYLTVEGIRDTVSHWVSHRLHHFGTGSEDFCLELARIEHELTCLMEHDVDQLNSSMPALGDLIHVGGRRRLFPQGKTLEEKYDDYRLIRDKVISCYNRLLGFARNHPVAVEVGEQLDSYSFPPPIPFSGLDHTGMSDREAQDASANSFAQIVRSKEQKQENDPPLSPLQYDILDALRALKATDAEKGSRHRGLPARLAGMRRSSHARLR
jgi:hypothetical protein